MTSEYVEYERLDPETGDIIGMGETLRSTVEALIEAGLPLRIVRPLVPSEPEPPLQN